MSIESSKHGYSLKDTSVAVTYVEDGVERTITVATVLVDGAVDFAATEASIANAVYGTDTPPSVSPVVPSE